MVFCQKSNLTYGPIIRGADYNLCHIYSPPLLSPIRSFSTLKSDFYITYFSTVLIHLCTNVHHAAARHKATFIFSYDPFTFIFIKFHCISIYATLKCLPPFPRNIGSTTGLGYLHNSRFAHSGGCMNCHFSAGTDSSFIWADGIEEQIPLN